jgi:hypothetical protein
MIMQLRNENIPHIPPAHPRPPIDLRLLLLLPHQQTRLLWSRHLHPRPHCAPLQSRGRANGDYTPSQPQTALGRTHRKDLIRLPLRVPARGPAIPRRRRGDPKRSKRARRRRPSANPRFRALRPHQHLLPERDLPHAPPLQDELPPRPPIACGAAREGGEGGHRAWGPEHLRAAAGSL